MVCRECKYMEMVDDNGLFVCKNEKSGNFMEYTGVCCEDDCEDGEEEEYYDD